MAAVYLTRQSNQVQSRLNSVFTGDGNAEITTAVGDRKSLPFGFPEKVTTELAWQGSQLQEDESYIHYLTEDEKAEIYTALQHFKGYGLDGDLVTCETFPLPKLQYRLRAFAQDLYHGKGLVLLRGLDQKAHSVEDGMVIFLGIQAYIAEQRARQDVRGNMIVHITPDKYSSHNRVRALHARHSRHGIAFHTDDNADIIAFQTRSTSILGGNCIAASAHTIYNELAATRPDVICTLAKPNWPFTFPYFHLRPILFYHDSNIIMHFNPTALLGSDTHPRPSSIPSITHSQREALDLITKLGLEHQLMFRTQSGDLHFVNNLAILHRRDGFKDSENMNPLIDKQETRIGEFRRECSAPNSGGKEKRHLVRMHLRNVQAGIGWSIPPVLKGNWDRAFDGENDDDQVWHIFPMPDRFFPLRIDSY